MIKKSYYSEAKDNAFITNPDDPKQDLLRANLLNREAILRIFKDEYAIFDLHVLFLVIILMVVTYPLLITTFIFTNRIVYAFSVSISLLFIYRNLIPLLRITISTMVLPLSIELLYGMALLFHIPLVPAFQLTFAIDTQILPFVVIFSIFDLFYFIVIFEFCNFIFKEENQNLRYIHSVPAKNIVFSFALFLGSLFLRSFITWLFNLYFISLFLVFLILVISIITML